MKTYGLVGTWVADHLWPRYTKPVSEAGWAIELNTFPDLYKAFLAWSQWKLFGARMPQSGEFSALSRIAPILLAILTRAFGYG